LAFFCGLGVGVFRAVFGLLAFCGLSYFIDFGWADLRVDGLLDLGDFDEPPLLPPPPPLPPLAIAELRLRQNTIVIARKIIVFFMIYSLLL
jgi:hypothetical protein